MKLAHIIILNLFLISMTLPVMAKQLKSSQKKTDALKLLSYQEFDQLYTADQLSYIKLLQKFSVDLSLQSDLVAQQKLRSFFYFFQTLNPEAEAVVKFYIEEQLREELTKLNASANVLKNVKPQRVDLMTRMSNGLADLLLDSPELAAFREHEKHKAAHLEKVSQALFRRNKLLEQIGLMTPQEQRRLLPILTNSNSVFTIIKNNVRFFGNAVDPKVNEKINKRYQIYPGLLAALQAELNNPNSNLNTDAARSELFRRSIKRTKQPTTVVNQRARQRTGTTVANSEPTNESTPTNSCVRCIYGGFVIVNKTKCESVRSLSDENQSAQNLVLPSTITNTQLNCESETEPVLCNPLLFGLKENGPLCVSKSASATRACSAASGKDEATMLSIRNLIRSNNAQYDIFSNELKSACGQTNKCQTSNSSIRSHDIDQTCSVIREQLIAFRDSMRTVASTESSPTPAASPALTETPTTSPAPAVNTNQ